MGDENNPEKRIPRGLFSVSGFISGLAVLLIFTAKPTKMPIASRTMLCLGDSYTIGESVPSSQNFPAQTVSLIRRWDPGFEPAEIVAKTGWSTDELEAAMDQHSFRESYEFVTLLIGVNNEYRGRPVDEYSTGFSALLKRAIDLAGKRPDHVIVISIPDWGVTPFAKSDPRGQVQISKEIDEYNKANKTIADHFEVNYIDITPGTRQAVDNLDLLAADGLHPSAQEYGRWAIQIADLVQSIHGRD